MTGLKLENVQCVKDLCVTILSNLKFSLHGKEATCKSNRMLGFINAQNIAKLEAVQRSATMMILFLSNIFYKERLARLNLVSLEKRRLRENL